MNFIEFNVLCDTVDCQEKPTWRKISNMTEHKSTTLVVRRRAQAVAGNTTRRNETSAELELISTQMLKQILSSADSENRAAIEEAANTEKDGVLVRDTATGYFEIIDNAELQQILDCNDDLPAFTRPSDPTLTPLHDYVETDSLSLVSTQALRHVFGDEEKVQEADPDKEVNVRGFNPYDCY